MVEIDGEKLMVSSSNFADGSMIVSVGTTDFDNYGDSDFMEMMINKDGKIDYFSLPTGKGDYQRLYKIKPSHYGVMKTQNETNESAGGDFIRTDGDGKYGTSFGAELLTPKFKGHDKCVECGSIEIPLSEMDGGEIGLSDYYFSCAECDFSWYVAVRTDEHEDGSSAGIEFVGFMDEDGNILEEPQEFNIMGQPNPAYQKSQSESFGAEFAGYEDPISERQRYRIRKLGGRIEKSMNRSDASRYIKSLMADPLHAETHALDCSTCQGWGWNEDLNMVCDADGCIGGWVVPKKPSLLERGLELGAGVGMGMASVAIVFGILGGTVGLAAEELKKRRE